MAMAHCPKSARERTTVRCRAPNHPTYHNLLAYPNLLIELRKHYHAGRKIFLSLTIDSNLLRDALLGNISQASHSIRWSTRIHHDHQNHKSSQTYPTIRGQNFGVGSVAFRALDLERLNALETIVSTETARP